jgi:glyoxylase-like metal-dependent hydrolase (beta-lactamase superfamily II)
MLQRWKIGGVTVTCIVERDLDGLLSQVLPDATPAAIASLRWLFPHFVDDQGRLRGNTQAFAVETPSRRLVVDTCIGNDKDFDTIRPSWSRLQTRFLDQLQEEAGFARESVDTVLCTHLHADHIGWNTMRLDGRWVPTFPKARYLLGRVEYEADQARSAAAGVDDARARGMRVVAAESLAPVLEAGLVDFVETDHVVSPEVSLVSTPGHTAGHVSVRLRSQGAEALITGDSVHHPCQFAHPEWASYIDHDPTQSTATRRRLFTTLGATPTLVIGSHFPAPTAGRVVRDGEAWRFEV